MTLRPYQHTARDNTFRDWAAGRHRLALVLPTGAGKTVIFSEIIRQHRTLHPELPVLVLAHRDELLQQAKEKIEHWVPGIPVGIVKAAQNQIYHPIIVASVQTLARGRTARLPPVGLVIVDECHRTMGPSYLKVLDELGCRRPDGPRTLGVTATFTREDTKRLTDFYEAVPFALDLVELILPDPVTGECYLCPPRFRRVLIEGLDLSGVPLSRLTTGRDLAATELADAMDRAGAPGVVAAAYHRHAADRSGMVFTPTVASAQDVADAFNEIGISAAMLSGKTSMRDRRRIMEGYNAGRIQVVTNAALLGEGVDAPITSCVVVARPTLSKTLFRQMVGRGLRLYPGKTDCLVLDVVGATGRNDLKTLNDITDLAVDIHEDEDLASAARRVLPAEPRISTLDGEGKVSGSLLAVDVDPWALEKARNRPKNAAGEPLTDEELAAIQEAKDLERIRKEEEAELRKKRRYKHIPMRTGWFLITNAGHHFIQFETTSGQKGFIIVVALPDGQFAVALHDDNVPDSILTVKPYAADAMSAAVTATLTLVQEAVERHRVDPDASWRRTQAGEKQIELAERLSRGSVDFEEYHYKGQVSDFITWGMWHRKVDNFASQVVQMVTSSATLAATST
jgi:superfamily II DNA or RNA helicase